jgi:hypothetical protein
MESDIEFDVEYTNVESMKPLNHIIGLPSNLYNFSLWTPRTLIISWVASLEYTITYLLWNVTAYPSSSKYETETRFTFKYGHITYSLFLEILLIGDGILHIDTLLLLVWC